MRVRSELGAEMAASMAIVARVLGVPRSTRYYHPHRRKAPEVEEILAARENARKVTGGWIEEYTTERPHQGLQYLPPRIWNEQRWMQQWVSREQGVITDQDQKILNCKCPLCQAFSISQEQR